MLISASYKKHTHTRFCSEVGKALAVGGDQERGLGASFGAAFRATALASSGRTLEETTGRWE